MGAFMSTYREALHAHLENRPLLLEAGFRQRPWAFNKRYQRFLGVYQLHQDSGLYFPANAPLEAIEAVFQASLLLPAELYLLALDYSLSVSFCEGSTLEGNSSTFYADFSAQGKSCIYAACSHREKRSVSPHVEISDHSLEGSILLAHWCHELGHLYFRNASWELKQKFRQLLAWEIAAGLVCELTAYAQSKLDEYLAEVEKYENGPCNPFLREKAFLAYCEECFCETLAVLVCRIWGREHPAFVSATTVSLAGRKACLEDAWGLDLSLPSEFSGAC
jgi:hypothetical protein